MSFNREKCHQLTVTKNIPTMYTLHNQTHKRVTSAKCLGVQLTEAHYWEKYTGSATAKANKGSVFAET